jgi:hypothetical protein
MKDMSVTGLISRIMSHYVVTADDGTQYELSAIYPWEAVAADHGSGVFAENLGKRMTATGVTDGHTIWKADLHLPEPTASCGCKPAPGPSKRSTRAKATRTKP